MININKINFWLYDEDVFRKMCNDDHKYDEDWEILNTNTTKLSLNIGEIGKNDEVRYYDISRSEWENQGGE